MSDDHKITATQPARRSFLVGAAIAGLGSVATVAHSNDRLARSNASVGSDGAQSDILDCLRIADTVQRERSARDAGQWEEMAVHWHPQSTVDVSWYQGDGAGFVSASRRNAASGRISLHQLAPTVVNLAGSRATAETPCQLTSFVPLERIDICLVGMVRLIWRAELRRRRWLIAGLRVIYIRDYILPCDPNRVPVINEVELASYRPSYRFLSYALSRSANRPRNDLPGLDKPETIEKLRRDEAQWLIGT